jgi:hypothetical protein
VYKLTLLCNIIILDVLDSAYATNKSWHDYDESLIERGCILMDIGFLKSWNKEIKRMYQGKVGAPFGYSHSYIQILAFLKIGFKIAYRTVQGTVRGISNCIKIEEQHFTHIRRRILKIKPSSVENLGLKKNMRIMMMKSQ